MVFIDFLSVLLANLHDAKNRRRDYLTFKYVAKISTSYLNVNRLPVACAVAHLTMRMHRST